MINALNLASQLIALVPAGMRPEASEGRQGYLHPTAIDGNVSEARITFIVRDFEVDGLKNSEQFLKKIASELAAQNRGSKIDVRIQQSYRNMKYDLARRPEVVEKALAAVERTGRKPTLTSIRGGTDGSRLSAMGLLTPNICGGGKNFHSKQEWIAVSALEACAQVTTELVWIWGEAK